MQIRGTWSAGPGDDEARFLADLRALRDFAAIGYDELAARAHYPSDILKEAENGPHLPGLPILSAYVRACEGDVLDWEERWRRLNAETPDDPGLPVRPAGASAAAVAGARAGVGVAPPDVYDPERIRAALRGDRKRSGKTERRIGDPGTSAPARASSASPAPVPAPAPASASAQAVPELPEHGSGSLAGRDGGSGWGTTPSWDPGEDATISLANGNHSATFEGRGPFEAAFTGVPDSAEPADSADPATVAWRPESETGPGPADSMFTRSEQTDAFTRPEQADMFTRPEQADAGSGEVENDFVWLRPADSSQQPPAGDHGLSWSDVASAEAAAEPIVSEWTPRHLDVGGLKSPERTDFWATTAPAEVQAPDTQSHGSWSSRAEEPTITRASWSPAAETVATPAPTSVPQRPSADHGAGSGSAAASHRGSAESAASAVAAPTAVRTPDDRRKDRLFPARLLVVVIIAALIGSALVLLLK